MFRLISGRNLLALSLMACAVFLFASPAQAQTGAVQGKVIDAAGKPLEKAVVTIEFTDGINRKYRGQDQQEGRVHPDWARPGQLQSHRVVREAGRARQSRSACASATR